MKKENSKKKDYQTDWAFNDDFTKYIHISEAKSGLNGYYCLGCKKEMQAAKGKIREHYFRHHATDVDKDTTECVVANRKYRELIARDILHRLKEIKVPALYKFPPKNVDGAPNQLNPAQTIRAHSVKAELTFYEDEDCRVQYGQNPNIDEKYLLIRPDITFFNEKNEPILLIEFVVTHKIDNDKRAKLKRLGLDTVQIIIPKKAAPEIEKALKSQSKVKWVYNGIEANTNYIFVPNSANNGVWEIDDEQRDIFEESYKCRASQLKYLIRTVKRALESQSYKRTEQQFESEISRVEAATKGAKQGLADLEERFEGEVLESLTGRYRDFKLQEEGFRLEEEKFQNRVGKLEERYLAKIREIRDEQESVDQRRAIELEDNRTEAEIREDFRRDTERLEGDFTARRDRIAKLIEAERRSLEGFSGEHDSLPEQFRHLEGVARQEFETAKTSLEQQDRNLPEEFKRLEEQEQREFETARAKLENEEAELEETVRDEFHRRIQSNSLELPQGIRTILEAQRVGHDFEDAKRKEQRYTAARKLFNQGTWKTW